MRDIADQWDRLAGGRDGAGSTKTIVIPENFRLRRAACNWFCCAILLEKCSKIAKTIVIPENFRLRRAACNWFCFAILLEKWRALLMFKCQLTGKVLNFYFWKLLTNRRIFWGSWGSPPPIAQNPGYVRRAWGQSTDNCNCLKDGWWIPILILPYFIFLITLWLICDEH